MEKEKRKKSKQTSRYEWNETTLEGKHKFTILKKGVHMIAILYYKYIL